MTSPVAYVYQADLYCPNCILPALGVPAGDLGRAEVEQRLEDVSHDFDINRYREESYDSRDFPKVAFLEDLDCGDRCAGCGARLR
jgi:hypothetical protein